LAIAFNEAVLYAHLINVFGILLTAGSLSLSAKPQARSDKPVKPCPDEEVYVGRYRNWQYGFSILIPAGRQGYWNSAGCAKTADGCVCMSDHGRVIPLSKDAHIEVYTGYAVLEGSARDYERYEITTLKKRQDVDAVKVLSARGVGLARLRARRYVVRFVEKNKSIITDRVVAIHQGVEYHLILRTSAERYRKDRREYERVIASWRLTPRIK
jgi:hypothetical protein